MKTIFMKEFLRLPTAADLKNIVKLHQSVHSVDGLDKSSLATRLLLPLKSLAYGVPPHTFIDYFQMSPQ
jgi:hypothetical protein